jgi:hypothetical protein
MNLNLTIQALLKSDKVPEIYIISSFFLKIKNRKRNLQGLANNIFKINKTF